MSGKLAVFDVDGTLVNSREAMTQAADTAFARLGRAPPPYEALRQIVGLNLVEGLAKLAPDLDSRGLEALATLFRSSFAELHRDPAFIEPLFEGAADLLDRLKREGWRIAMATGKSRRGVDTIIAMHRWADLFDSTHCSDDGPGKPHPSMLIEAMKVLGMDRRDTVMVGDTAFDMQMARSAGVRAVGVAWGFHTRQEVERGGADWIAESFEALGAELERFGAG